MAKIRRYTIPTCLLVVEGETELAFCLFIKRCLGRGNGVQVVIENAHGGCPLSIVRHAQRLAQLAAYDRVVVLLDGDLPIGGEALSILQRLEATTISPSPCIEAMLLEMLGHRMPRESAACKSAFHKKGLSAAKKLEAENYGELFEPADLGSLAARCATFGQIYAVFRPAGSR